MNQTNTIRIGTRRSLLAMWQTKWVQQLLIQANPSAQVEIVPLQTLGDRDKSTALTGLGRTGVFTKEIEQALLDNQCDIAVHSLKDLATSQPKGLCLGAIPKREAANDVLVSKQGTALNDLASGTRVGTSSLRRKALLLNINPGLTICGLRGNVPTRLKAVSAIEDDGAPYTGDSIDCTILALAGLKRLKLDHTVTEILPIDQFLPAPAQGAVGIQIREDDSRIAALLAPLNHMDTAIATQAERAFLSEMEGGCHMPLGAHATVHGSQIKLATVIATLDGQKVMRGNQVGENPLLVAKKLCDTMKANGALEILAEISTAMNALDQ